MSLKIGPVTERMGVMASCPIGHKWFTVTQTFFRGYGQTLSGRKSPRYETKLDIPNCPDCGLRWGATKPVGIDRHAAPDVQMVEQGLGVRA